jgi:hypothetical protein
MCLQLAAVVVVDLKTVVLTVVVAVVAVAV